MTTFYVSSGQTSSGLTIGPLDAVIVNGGTLLDTMVLSGGFDLVQAGGTASSTVLSGGTEFLYSGGISSDTSVGSGGMEIVSGGVSMDAAVTSGGVITNDFGITSSASIGNGGSLLDSGTALMTSVGSGGSMTVSGFAGNTTIDGGGVVMVFGSASYTDVQAGGTLVILPYAMVSNTIAQSGADVISADVLIESRGHIVSFGQVLSGGIISNAFSEDIYNGGTAVGATIQAGGYQFVASGGVASLTTVGSGVYPRGGGELSVTSGGRVVSAFVQSGGTLTDDSGRVDATSVLQGGTAYFYSGTSEQLDDAGEAVFEYGATGLLTTVDSGGKLYLQSGGVLSHTSVNADAALSVGYRGVADGTVVSSGGVFYVGSAGSAVATTVDSGAAVLVISGASFHQISVQAGGTLAVEQHGSAFGVISAAGAEVFISTGVIVVEDGSLVAASSGTLSGFHTSHATIDIRQGAATDGFVNFDATEAVLSGGIDSGSVFQVNYYDAYNVGYAVSGGGQMFGDTVEGGAVTVASGGLADDVTLSGLPYYDYAGTASMEVTSGGFVTGTMVYQSDVFVSGGAVFNDSFIYSGSYLGIDSGAFASDTVIRTGNMVVESGGVVSASIVSAFSFEQIISGGFSIGATVSSGGAEVAQGSGGSTDVHLLAGGTLELSYFQVGSGGSAQLNQSTDVLTVTGNGQSTTVQLAGDYTGEQFGVSDTYFYGYTGALITVEGTPCYCRGTHILTTNGEVPVEDLRIGDHLITRSGEPRALRWIGRRSYAGRFAANNRDVLPVLFQSNALGGGLPRRDLYVSPLHAMYLDGMLIPAACLVNNDTIQQVESIDQVDYFHLELDTHDVIIAEGALSETYIDDDNRGMFHNAAEHAALYPGAPRAAPAYCAPRVEDGEALHDVRRRLQGAPPRAPVALRGSLDLVERHRVAGWAMADDAAPVRLRLIDNGVVINEFTADLCRPDVRDVVGGDGHCGFNHIIEGGLAPDIVHLIQVQRATDAKELSRSPWLLEWLPRGAPADPAPLRGCLDEADRVQVQGWACAGADPVDLQIIDNGTLIGRVLANRFRTDLADANHNDGRCAFAYRFPASLSPGLRHVIEVRRESDGAALENSPLLIEAADAFDAALQDAVAHAVAAIADQDRDRVLSFLLTQTDRLKQRTADGQVHRTERDDLWQFRRRWGAVHTLPNPALRALVIDRDLPRPDHDAGSQAILSHMQALQRLGYEVSFVAAEQMSLTNAWLTEANITNCVAPTYASVEDVLRRQAGCFDLIYLHRAGIADTYMALSRRWMPKARIVYAVADLHHLRLARQAETEQRPELLAQSRRLRLAECSAAWHADAVITHSAHEAAVLRQAVPHADVHVVPWHVPLRPTTTPFAQRQGLAFIANYAHDPNVDAARFLIEDIMPLVWAVDPAIECRLAGTAMPAVIRALAAPKVFLLGHVTDLATLFEQVRLTVAPLRYGAGIKGKVLASLAAGIACAATPIAAEGLALPPNLVAGDPAALAALILRLHRNPVANRNASRAGLAVIAAANTTDQVDAALSQAVAQSARRVASRLT